MHAESFHTAVETMGGPLGDDGKRGRIIVGVPPNHQDLSDGSIHKLGSSIGDTVIVC